MFGFGILPSGFVYVIVWIERQQNAVERSKIIYAKIASALVAVIIRNIALFNASRIFVCLESGVFPIMSVCINGRVVIGRSVLIDKIITASVAMIVFIPPVLYACRIAIGHKSRVVSERIDPNFALQQVLSLFIRKIVVAIGAIPICLASLCRTSRGDIRRRI